MGEAVGKVRFLGVDFGASRSGLALSDLLGITCRPFGILAEHDEEGLVSAIVSAAKEQGVETIVVGLPRPLSGGTNDQVEDVLEFVRHLRVASDVPVLTWDERFTSKLAKRLKGADGEDDAIAACYMLQSYLDTLEQASGGDQDHE